MKLVEVVRCVTTSDEAFETALEFARSEGKLAIPTRDKAGFIVNRLLVPYMLDAMRAYEEGVGSVAEIDEAMKAGAGHPMGPLTLADFVGLDTLGSICDVLFDEFRERRFARPPTLRKMLSAGWYGRKSGMGFYDYSGESRGRTPPSRCSMRRSSGHARRRRGPRARGRGAARAHAGRAPAPGRVRGTPRPRLRGLYARRARGALRRPADEPERPRGAELAARRAALRRRLVQRGERRSDGVRDLRC